MQQLYSKCLQKLQNLPSISARALHLRRAPFCALRPRFFRFAHQIEYVGFSFTLNLGFPAAAAAEMRSANA